MSDAVERDLRQCKTCGWTFYAHAYGGQDCGMWSPVATPEPAPADVVDIDQVAMDLCYQNTMKCGLNECGLGKPCAFADEIHDALLETQRLAREQGAREERERIQAGLDPMVDATNAPRWEVTYSDDAGAHVYERGESVKGAVLVNTLLDAQLSSIQVLVRKP